MKNKFGLLESDLTWIVEVISSHRQVEQAFIFGSRAKGNFRPGSDVDLALKGKNLDFETVSKISYILNEETLMPYKFDVINYHRIQEPELVLYIDRIGIEVFNRKKESQLVEDTKGSLHVKGLFDFQTCQVSET
ncbi:nucleotidyltransferase family protein [Algoriphagus boritolerans]|uniref:Predicted nucleotidyltransferase n=1 Tax=Algoriphagus boritolerans DSM 17298 = JCM 18970 TaxID=1120964 RepID=A0A1H5YBA0_9BACT|nr:nucleotidyltransferase domain-containing protein [Algoriphagus boritolerans]SEG20890.1 Predicted nucleotidyltransferase [Algoriphagus boritolerans DSM 17298 = JCM 18970]